MSRVFITPQAGRPDKGKGAEDEPWGTTSAGSAFRAFEPAEMRSCRSGPAHLKPCLQPSGAFAPARSQVSSASRSRSNLMETIPEMASAVTVSRASRTVPEMASAVTVSRASRNSGGQPAWAQVHQRPIPARPWGAATTEYRDSQQLAQEARHDHHFPYRDEFAPRSKRLLYEMALERCSRDDVRSASTDADEVSCFTVPSSYASGKSGRRSASTPSLASSGRLMTGDSRRIVGGLARRRKEAQLRAPMQWEADMDWVAKKCEEEGPAGLSTANVPGHAHGHTCRKISEKMNGFLECFDGKPDNVPRDCPGAVAFSRSQRK